MPHLYFWKSAKWLRELRLLPTDEPGFWESLGYHNHSHEFASFAPTGGDWQTLRLPISAFGATFRGRDFPCAPALDPAQIRQVGLMIAARQAGPFALDIRSINLA